jgi:hypothetical protein
MLAAVGVIGAFVPIVVAVTLLLRRGRLGDPERRLPFASYGPVLAGALTGGAAAVHLGLIGEHAALALGPTAGAATGGLVGAAAFVCSVGAGASHFTAVNTSIAGFLPVGVASLGLAPIHAIWSIPRLWRRAGGALAGVAVTAAVLLVSVIPILAGPGAPTAGLTSAPSTAPASSALAYSDVLEVVLELALVLVFTLLVLRRPRALLDRLEVRVADAWIGTGLGVAAVGIFALVALIDGHALH